MTLSNRPACRRRRAYTIVELAVVCALTSLLVFGMIRWLIGVGGAAQAGYAESADRDVVIAVDQLRADLNAIRHCSPVGADARIISLSADTLTLAADEDGDGVITMVTWQYANGTLRRGEAAFDAGCAVPQINQWVTWVDGVTAFTFGAVRDGNIDPNGTGQLPCTNEYEPRCQIASIAVNVETAGAAGTTGTVIDVTGPGR